MAKSLVSDKQTRFDRGDGRKEAPPATSGGWLTAPAVYAPGSQTTAAVTTTTMAAFDSVNITTGAFNAPASGSVIITVSLIGKTSTTGVWVQLGLAAHGSVAALAGNSVGFESSTSDASALNVQFFVGGLTPGTSYQFDLLGCCTSGDTYTIYAFGQSTVTPTVSGSGGQGAPVILTVQAV